MEKIRCDGCLKFTQKTDCDLLFENGHGTFRFCDISCQRKFWKYYPRHGKVVGKNAMGVYVEDLDTSRIKLLYWYQICTRIKGKLKIGNTYWLICRRFPHAIIWRLEETISFDRYFDVPFSGEEI